MKLLTRNPIQMAVINGETKYFQVDPIPDDVYLKPSFAAVQMGLDVKHAGTDQIAVENTHAVIRMIPPAFEVATVYKAVAYKAPAKQAELPVERKKIA